MEPHGRCTRSVRYAVHSRDDRGRLQGGLRSEQLVSRRRRRHERRRPVAVLVPHEGERLLDDAVPSRPNPLQTGRQMQA